jgi:hypothetical protein
VNLQRLKSHNRLNAIGLMILFFWLKGAGCAVCCTTEFLKPLCHGNSTAGKVAATDMPAKERDCCRPAAKNSCKAEPDLSTDEASPLQVTGSGELKACSLLASQTLGFTVSWKSASQVMAAPELIAVVSSTTASPVELSFAHPPELRNRSGTYLRCCALLI